MNNSYVLSCCSTVDLNPELMQERNIPFVNFHYFLDEQEHTDDMGATISMDEFYQSMTNGAEARTAQVNVEEYCRFFEQYLQQGLDILHVSLSSGLSGTSNSARIAAEMLGEKYPERRVRIVDSLGASSGSGLFVITLADMRDAGMELEELYQWAEEHKLEMHHWFSSYDLTFYVKGGRITKAAGWFGTVLKICPVLNMDYAGRLIPRYKIRGKQKALLEMVNQMEQHAKDGLNYNGRCFMCQSASRKDAEMVAAEVKKRFPLINGDVLINDIGPTIGSHTGPGTIALFFWGDKREN